MKKEKIKLEKLHNSTSLKKTIEKVRKEGKKIVLTSGSWDILHVGHMRYLKNAREAGDFLVVGVDSDKKIKKRKGPDRPVVPETERLEMLSHLEYVDVLFLKLHTHKSQNLIKIVRPDILIVSKRTKHDPKHLKEIQEYCKKTLVLPPLTKTGTTERIRLLHINGKKDLATKIMNEMPKFISSFLGND